MASVDSIGVYIKKLGFSSPMGPVEFRFEGDWVKLNRFLKYLGGRSRSLSLKRDLAKTQRDWLQRFKIKLIKGLLSEGSSIGAPFEPHAQGYYGGASIGYRNGVYLDALRNLRIIQKNYQVSLTFYPGDLNRKSRAGGYRLSQYALLFEQGSKNQPARPIWGPTLVSMGGGANLVKNLYGALGKRLTKLGIR